MALPVPQNYKFEKEELTALRWQYSAIYDCLNRKVKERGTVYLPHPNPDDESQDAVDSANRYSSYLTRAVFYDVAGRTLAGLVGQVYANDPEVVLPEALKQLQLNVDGTGTNLIQSSKETLEETLAYGRSGLYIDYPDLEQPATKEQLSSGEVKPSISLYTSQRIINWQFTVIGGSRKLTLVVLKEWVPLFIDSFEERLVEQYRVLRVTQIDSKWVYSVEVYSKDVNGQETYSAKIPLDVAGKPFEEMQFEFVGANDNGPEPDQPPLLPLVELNLGHYRNSADYEESCFVVGQPTLVVAGLTEDWLKDVLKGKIRVGSRSAIPLPFNGSAKLLQIQPNTLPHEAMLHKEKQMVAIGAKLIEDRRVQKTATEANIHNAAETSILSTTAKNVSAAITSALKKALKYVSNAEETIIFDLNTDFSILRLTAQERQELILEWQSGAISFTEMRTVLRSSGIAIDEDTLAKPEIDKEMKERAALGLAMPLVGIQQTGGAPATPPTSSGA